MTVPVALIASRIAERASLSTDGGRFLSFRAFHRLTEGLTGPERAEVFAVLADDLQGCAWRVLAQDIELADQDLADPLDRAHKPRDRTRRSTNDPVGYDRHAKDPLVTIEPRDYVEALADVEVGQWGTIRCPLPGHDHERTGSFKVYDSPERGWRCYGCSRGGSIFDFGAHLWGIGTRGRDFRDLRARLRRELGIT